MPRYYGARLQVRVIFKRDITTLSPNFTKSEQRDWLMLIYYLLKIHRYGQYSKCFIRETEKAQ